MPNARSRKFDVIDSKSLDRISRHLEDLGGFHNAPRLPGVHLIAAQVLRGVVGRRRVWRNSRRDGAGRTR